MSAHEGTDMVWAHLPEVSEQVGKWGAKAGKRDDGGFGGSEVLVNILSLMARGFNPS